ncbi:hypothetical protein Tco_1112435 [Tanacetum coccineum]|uniref:Aspartic peptidase DDI1-type domain-containing protein n=1 Tax=Tanacetum coccineum TaxID=301880 RepID=A0ABQ5IPE2_9ASTR
MDHNSAEATLKFTIQTPKRRKTMKFHFTCFIKNVAFDNALVDLGANVSVMPLSTNHNLGLGELAHTKLTVELAVKTVKYPKGIAKNVLVGIGKFTFPVDFIILDMPEDIKVPLILGRPFLFTARAKIDVYKRNITLRVWEERIVFTNDDEVTYQMVRSHPRFKRHTNEQCNKIPPLLKVSEKDEKNGISHAYQKLKGFYKGVLNLGPDYIRNAKTEEWLTRGHISVHEME